MKGLFSVVWAIFSGVVVGSDHESLVHVSRALIPVCLQWPNRGGKYCFSSALGLQEGGLGVLAAGFP